MPSNEELPNPEKKERKKPGAPKGTKPVKRPPPPPPPKRKPRTRSRGHPLMWDRPAGVWYADAVGVIPGYPSTQEIFDKKSRLCRERIIKLNAEGRAGRRGVPDGWAYRKKELKIFRAVAREKAKRIVEVMAKEDNIVDERAISAMVNAVEIFETRDENSVPIFSAKDRLTAMRLVLEYTTPKPAQKQDITLTSSEAWLASLAEKANVKD